jgi:DNA-binding transcriptional regulator YdaS (Cro superfamily)
MALKKISAAKQREIAKLRKQGLTYRKIAQRVGVHFTIVGDYVRGDSRPAPKKTTEEIESSIRKQIKRAPVSPDELAEGLGIGSSQVRRMLAAMDRRGVLLVEHPDGRFEMASTINIAPGRFELRSKPGVEQLYGITSDNHLCSKYSRLDVLNAAYDHFARRGITHVFNAGNMIDGEARFNKTELLTAPGMDNQIDYWIDNWPVRKGITTDFIAGDDHEGWYAQREGIEIGRYMESRAKSAGREDLHYLGYAEADVSLRCGSGASVMRVVHPGGGSAYATSYTAQKLVESYQGGEKPHVLVIGHYHKFEHGYPREVHCVQAGRTEDQSLFMRKRKLSAHVGFLEMRIIQDAAGVINRFGVEWFPFFDRGFYEKRFR